MPGRAAIMGQRRERNAAASARSGRGFGKSHFGNGNELGKKKNARR